MKSSKWNKELVIKTIKDIEKQLGKRPAKRDSAALYQATRKYFGTWNNAMKAAGYKIFEKQNPILPKKLTPELSYFLGLLITDGHLQADKRYNRYKLSLYTSYEEEVKIVSNLMNFLFRCEPRVYKKKKYGFNIRTNHDIYINSKDLTKHLNINFNIPTGAKSISARIPKIIFNTNKSNINSFIRGVFDGDGCIHGKNSKKQLGISSGSKNFLNDLNKLLIKININKKKINNKPTAFEIRFTHRKDLFNIYKLFYNKAKFYYPRKKEKFEKVIFKNRKSSLNYCIPGVA